MGNNADTPDLLANLVITAARSAPARRTLARVFRAAVHVDGVPAADVIQCWLDVSGEPARGTEQAAFIWRRVLGSAITNGEPEP